MKYLQLIKAIDSASAQLLGRAAAVVNQALVIRNWLVGAYIVEFEQNGEDRAKHGQRLLQRLPSDLARRGVKGTSPDMLERMRSFACCYPQLGQGISAPVVRKLSQFGVLQIPQPLVTESADSLTISISAPAVRKFGATTRAKIGQQLVGQLSGITPLSARAVLQFSWSQIIELIRIDDPLKRAFYENQCLQGNWSKRQLQRQIGSLLFERTGLSKNKAAVIARARRSNRYLSVVRVKRIRLGIPAFAPSRQPGRQRVGQKN